ncbi:MAG: insulinase family protein, partial [Archangium sp.]|nr:insulinase family protein [Archangium sp.]
MNARALLLVLLAGCATAPAPVVVKELPKDAAQLELDSLVVKPAPTEAVPYRALPSIEPMKLVVLPVPNKPIVSVRLVFRTGSVDDPSGKEGLTALT